MNYKLIGGDRKEYGPASAEELRRWFEEGRLNSQSLVRPEPGGEWQPLGSVPEFADLFGSRSVPPPLPGQLAAPADTRDLAAQAMARAPAPAVGACLSRSWALLQANFGLLAAACLLVWLVSLVEFVPVAGLVYPLLAGPLLGGLYRVFLKRIRNQPAHAGEALSGFSEIFGQLLLAGFVSRVLTIIGFLFCAVPGVYLFVAWIFCVPLAADQRLEFWSAMELSRKVVSRVWFSMLGLLLIAWLPFVLATLFMLVKGGIVLLTGLPGVVQGGQPDLGRLIELRTQVDHAMLPLVLMLKVVWLLNLPFAVGALMYAYEDLFGARPTPAA